MRDHANALPSGWIATSLGDVTEERGERVGRRDAPRVLSSTKHHGLVPSDDYFKGRTIYSSDISLYKRVHRNWFAYATNHLSEGSIGLQSDMDVGCVSPIYTVFSCGNNAEPRYLRRLLKSPSLMAAYQLHEQASVDRRGAVRYRDFAKIKIALPPLWEQLRIAEVLDSVDESIRSTERLIAKLANIRLGIAGRLLTDHRRQASPVQVRTIAVVFNGTTPSRQRPDYWAAGTIPWLSSGKVNDRIVTSPSEYVTTQAVRDTGLRLASEGSIIIGMIGDGRTRGMAARLGIAAAINQNLAAVVPHSGVDSAYLHLCFEYDYQALRAASRGSNQDALNTRLIGDFEISLPSYNEQVHCRDVVAGIESATNEERAKLEKLRQVKQGLTEDLLTGRVRVVAREELAA